MKAKDIFLILLIGLLSAVFTFPILENIIGAISPYIYAFIIIAAPILALVALYIFYAISKKRPVFWQIGKFSATGALNVIIDFGILNFLSFVFNVFSGPLIILFNIISLSVAVNNSYLWNHHWTFTKNHNSGTYGLFIAVTFVGLIINTALLYFLTTVIGPQNTTEQIWENISKIIASVPAIIWDFIGYKYFVFEKIKTPGANPHHN